MVTSGYEQKQPTMIKDKLTPNITAASAVVKRDEQLSHVNVEPRSSKFCTNQPTRFPLKLMQVLSMKEHSNIITWLHHGRSFAIVNPKEFVSVILHFHFRKVKYSSFTRKLHRWGFQRVSRGEEAGSYYHKLFQRDNKELCQKMSTNQGQTASKASRNYSDVYDPALIGSLRLKNNEQNDCHISQAGGADKVTMTQLYSSLGFVQPVSQDHSLIGLSTPELIHYVPPPMLQAQTYILPDTNIHRDVLIDQNKVDQIVSSRRFLANNRAAAISRRALMMMQTPALVLGRPGVCQLNLDGTKNHFQPEHKTHSGAVDITSIALKQDSGLGAAIDGKIHSNYKNIFAVRNKRMKTLSLSSALPPSA
mmetsp:Transcript_29878/g.43497  ORF Transcript_29878/g.43497 Transcript_29878/m.43497 type:complete len:363 (+) Transcript_29878:63-1151(+)